MYLTWNGLVLNTPWLLFEDEITYAENEQGLLCRSEITGRSPYWYNPRGYRVIPWPSNEIGLYQTSMIYQGSSRLIFKRQTSANTPGLYTCRLTGHGVQPVALGIYPRSGGKMFYLPNNMHSTDDMQGWIDWVRSNLDPY